MAQPRQITLIPFLVLALGASDAMSENQPTASNPAPTTRPAPPAQLLSLRVASYNILMGRAQRKVFENMQSVRPDVLFLQEAPRDLVKSFARSLDLNYNFGPYQADGRSGLAILATGKIQPVKLFTFPDDRNFALAAQTVLDDRRILLVCVHFKSLPRPLLKGMFQTLGPHLEQAEAVIKLTNENPVPAVVGGDFNTVAVTPAYRALAAAFNDTAVGAASTQPTIFVNGAGYRIDHLFVRGPWKVIASRVSPRPGSDHRLIWTDLKLLAK